MSKILKSPWFWVAVIAIIIIGGYIVRKNYVEGGALLNLPSGSTDDESTQPVVDVHPGQAVNPISATNGIQSPISVQPGV